MLVAVGWVVCCAVWTAYLLAFWPGFLTEDSVDQWSQALSGTFRNEHPVSYAMVARLLTRIWASPAAVAFSQILLLSSAVALAARELLRWRAPYWVVIATLGLIVLSPVTGLMTITLWKDLPYSAMLVVLFVVTMRLVATRGTWVKGVPGAITLVSALCLLSLLRHNGQFVALVALVAMTLIWRGLWRRFALVGLTCAAVVLLMQGPIAKALQIAPINPYFLLANQTHQLAAILHDGATLTEEEKAVVAGVMPLDEWVSSYSCCTVMPTFARGNQAFVTQNFNAYLRTVASLAVRHPGALLRRQACVSSSVWYPAERTGCPTFTFYPGIVPNDAGLQAESKAPALQATLAQIAADSQTAGNKEIFWRPAVYLYLHLLCVAVAAARLRRLDVLMLALSAGANALVLLALSTVQDFRFHYGLCLIAMLSPALLFVPFPLERRLAHSRGGDATRVPVA